jgi:hypothetical protein
MLIGSEHPATFTSYHKQFAHAERTTESVQQCKYFGLNKGPPHITMMNQDSCDAHVVRLHCLCLQMLVMVTDERLDKAVEHLRCEIKESLAASTGHV